MNISCIKYKVSGMQSNHRKVWHKSYAPPEKINWECYLTMILETVFGGFHWWGAMKSQDFSISWWFSESSISADTEPISKFLDALERGDPNSFISGTFDHPVRCYHTTRLPFVRAIFTKMSSRRPIMRGKSSQFSAPPPMVPMLIFLRVRRVRRVVGGEVNLGGEGGEKEGGKPAAGEKFGDLGCYA